MNRKAAHLVAVVHVVCALYGCADPQTAPPVARGANIVFIVVDTLRADRLGVYGHSRDTSPNIDAFARDACSSAVRTRPGRRPPAMASVFTSNPPHVHGVRKIPQSLPNEVTYIPEEIRRHGYTTGAVVSNAAAGEGFGFRRGFDFWVQGDDVAGSVTSKGIEALDELQSQGNRPFFLWLHYLEPHAPYKPSAEYHEMFVGNHLWAEEEVPFSDSEFGAYRMLPQIVNVGGNTNPNYYIAEYDAEIRTVDSEIGRFLDELRKCGLYDSSLIVFTADHGEGLGEHEYYFDHGMFPYDANGHIPLAIRYPKMEPAATDVPASLVDVLPTVLKAVGMPVPEGSMGADLLSLVTANDTDRPIFAESGYQDEPQVSVRKGDWKLIYIQSRSDRRLMTGGEYELYNIVEDPSEERNLAGQGLEVEAELTDLLTDWLDTWDDFTLPGSSTDGTISLETWQELQALGYVQGKEQALDLLANITRARIDAPSEDHVKATAFTVAGESRPVLFQHPDSSVTFQSLRLSRGAKLTFGIGVRQDVWDKEGDGVLFEIVVSNVESGEEETVYSRYIDPKSRPEDRKWVDEAVNLGAFADKLISINFRTSSGPEGNDSYDWAGWSIPKLVIVGVPRGVTTGREPGAS